MPDNTEEESIDFVRDSTERSLNHIVRHDNGIRGIVNIEAREDDKYNVKLHKGTSDEARVIEGVSKSKLMKMMEEQL